MRKEKAESLLGYYGFTPAERKKYPVVAGILRELTPERIKKEIEEVKKVELPAELQKWVEEYEKAGGKRNNKIWLFVYQVINKAFPYVAYNQKYKQDILEVKFLFSMFTIIVDDIADEKGDDVLLGRVVKFLFYDTSKEDIKKIDKLSFLAFSIVKQIYKKIEPFPFFNDFKDLLKFEIIQIVNSMKFSILANKNRFLISEIDFWNFFPCAMQIMLYAIFELMCVSKKVALVDLKKAREIILIAQKMGRVGNWISTWEREINEKDFTSMVFVYALKQGVIKIDDLEKKGVEKIIKKSDIEKNIFKEWNSFYKNINNVKNKNNIIKIKDLSRKLKKLLILQLVNNS